MHRWRTRGAYTLDLALANCIERIGIDLAENAECVYRQSQDSRKRAQSNDRHEDKREHEFIEPATRIESTPCKEHTNRPQRAAQPGMSRRQDS